MVFHTMTIGPAVTGTGGHKFRFNDKWTVGWGFTITNWHGYFNSSCVLQHRDYFLYHMTRLECFSHSHMFNLWFLSSLIFRDSVTGHRYQVNSLWIIFCPTMTQWMSCVILQTEPSGFPQTPKWGVNPAIAHPHVTRSGSKNWCKAEAFTAH